MRRWPQRRDAPVSTTPEQPHQWTADDFVPTQELVRRQGIRPLRSIDDLGGDDPFESDDEYEAFLADLYESRQSSAS